jgi:hypothetical protein
MTDLVRETAKRASTTQPTRLGEKNTLRGFALGIPRVHASS